MPDSPLAYFGNRSEALEDIFALIEIQREGKQYACFYDLFAGSGSLSLAAMKRGIAQRYVVNDIYKPLTAFWQAVRDTPEALITAYEKLVDTYLQKEYKDRELFYQTIQAEFNVNQLKQADANAYFAFIINHAAQGMPKFAHDQLACTVTSDLSELEIDKDFSCRVKSVHELFKKHDVTFTALDFVNYLELVTAEDLAICNPPYPDMLDQEESPTEYIYQRTENKAQLQVQLSQLLQLFERNQVSFLLFYGVLGFKNHYPLVWPQGHILHLVENPKQPDFAYVEHLYVSYSLLPAVLSEQCPSTIQPNFYRLFEVHALKHDFFPEDRIALVAGEQRYTYEQINCAANRLARYLLAQGLEQALAQKSDQEPLVALYLDRCPQLFISILALMKCGVAYLPLETKHERLSAEAAYARIERSQASYVLTHSDLGKTLQQIAHNTIQTIEVSRDDFLCEQLMGSIEDDSNLHRAVSRTDLAYVMYTSGTTGGEPKGVEILQHGLIYAFESHQDLLNLGCEDRVAQFASIGFDASLMEVMMAWGAGAQLHLINDAQYSDIKLLMAFLQAHEITIAIQTPKMLAGLDANNFPHLRGLLIVGDCFPKTLSDAWLKEIVVHGRKQLRQVLNGYGLTETTICTTLDPCAVEKPLSIGHAILGLEIYLRPIEAEMDNKPLMENQWLTFSKSNTTTHNLNYEPHTSYALYVSGVGLARGYWQRPQLTHERFQTISLQGKTLRVYQTGDVGYLTTQGSFVVTGRVDRQVKIRGQRVELGEIEEQLKQHPAVEDVYVFAPRINTGERRLAAYIVPKDKQLLATLTGKIVLQAIHQALSKMPNYMIPALVHMAFCPVLPRKTNDKKNYDIAQIERWGLPIRRYSDDMISPYTEIELQLQAIWAKVLGYKSEQLSLTDNFYELGADSILVNQMLNEVQQTLLQEYESIPVQDFHVNPTLQGLVQLVQRAKNALDNFTTVTEGLVSELPNTIQRDTHLHAFIKDSLSAQLKLLGPQLSQPIPPRVEIDTIFCIHSLSGDARQDLQNSQLRKLPVRLIYLNVDKPAFLPKTIEAIATNYVEHIRKTQAQGPYWLLGWSLGGVIAFEMARQLQQQGEMVRVWLLDSEAPALTHALTNAAHIKKLVEAIDKLARLKTAYLKQIPDNYYEIFQLDMVSESLADDKIIQSQFVFQCLREKFLASWKLWPAEAVTIVENLLTTTQILYEARLSYAPNNLKALKDYTLFAAEATVQEVMHLSLGWRVRSVVVIKAVNHFELLGHSNFQDALIHQLVLKLSFIKEMMIEKTKDANYYIVLGVLHMLQKQYELALTLFDGALKCNMKNAAAYRYRGTVFFELKQYKQALAEYEFALQINDNDALTYFARGYVYYALMQWHEALADFKKAIDLNKKDPGFYHNCGSVYAHLNQYDQALAEYDKGLMLDPTCAEIYYNRGVVYSILSQYNQALIEYNKALALGMRNAKLYYNRGVASANLKHYAQALEDYDKAFILGNCNAEIYHNRGVAYSNLSDYNQALVDYDKAIALGMKEAILYYNRGVAFENVKRYDQALEEYDKALASGMNDAQLYYNRSCVYKYLEQFNQTLDKSGKALIAYDAQPIYNHIGASKFAADVEDEKLVFSRQDQHTDTLNEEKNVTVIPTSSTETINPVSPVKEIPITEKSSANLISHQSVLFSKPDSATVSIPTQEEIQLNWAIAVSQQAKCTENDDLNNFDIEQESTDDIASSDEECIRPLLKK